MTKLLAAAVAAGVVCACAGASTSRLHVALKDTMQARPIEGYIWFVRLDGGRPKTGVSHPYADFLVRPGRHRVESWIRSCDGNCGLLDPPSHRCSAVVRAPGRVTVRLVDAGCRVTA